jgi:hypothetical protein
MNLFFLWSEKSKWKGGHISRGLEYCLNRGSMAKDNKFQSMMIILGVQNCIHYNLELDNNGIPIILEE